MARLSSSYRCFSDILLFSTHTVHTIIGKYTYTFFKSRHDSWLLALSFFLALAFCPKDQHGDWSTHYKNKAWLTQNMIEE